MVKCMFIALAVMLLFSVVNGVKHEQSMEKTNETETASRQALKPQTDGDESKIGLDVIEIEIVPNDKDVISPALGDISSKSTRAKGGMDKETISQDAGDELKLNANQTTDGDTLAKQENVSWFDRFHVLGCRLLATFLVIVFVAIWLNSRHLIGLVKELKEMNKELAEIRKCLNDPVEPSSVQVQLS